MTSYYTARITEAIGAWNSRSIPVTLWNHSGTTPAQVQIWDASYSWPAWAQVVYSCSGGYFTNNSVRMEINTRTMATLTTKEDRFVIIHEFGHALSLGHTTLGCGVSIMRSNANVGCSGSPPWPDDVAGVNAKY